MRAAVTGATGFVGRHLVAHLRDHGDEVLALSRREAPGVDVALDYLSVPSLTRALAGCDVVHHLAARAHQPRDPQEAAAFQRANVDTTVAVAQACVAAGVGRLVFCSSIGVNGPRSGRAPFTGDDAPAPAEPYAVSKLAAERRLADVLAGSATQHVILRPPLVYGPDCPGNFRTLLRLATRAPLVPLGGLREPRTFIHIDNLVSALRMAAGHAAAAGRTFTVGDAEDLSVAEIVRTVAGVIGRGRVVDVPPALLGLILRLLGRGDAWSKLSAPLQVDIGPFVAATGWKPPRAARQALRETARAFVAV